MLDLSLGNGKSIVIPPSLIAALVETIITPLGSAYISTDIQSIIDAAIVVATTEVPYIPILTNGKWKKIPDGGLGYYWSHRFIRNKKHIKILCRYKLEGYKDNSAFKYKMSGKTNLLSNKY